MNRGQANIARHMMERIKKEGSIHKFDLMDVEQISIWKYKAIIAWFEYRYRDFVKYDTKTKIWTYIAEVKEE